MGTAGGRGGIRTHETVARLAVFKTAAFNHSATLPTCTGAPYGARPQRLPNGWTADAAR